MAKDPYRYFRIEAHELVEQLGIGVLDIEKGQTGAEPVQRLLRLAHTLKGAARVVRQAEIADLIHGVEDALTPYRDGVPALPRDRIDRILAAFDAIGVLLAALPTADAAPAAAAPAAIASARPAASGLTASESAVPAHALSTPAAPGAPIFEPDGAMRMVRADVGEIDALLDGLVEIGGELAGLRRGLAQLGAASGFGRALRDPGMAGSGKGPAPAADMKAMTTALERGMTAAVDRIDRELRQTRDAAERLRLIPVAGIFHALERTARDAARSVGKQLSFEASGGDLRIDGDVLDVVQGALVQLVRNAVAHGIETPAERRAAGKQPAGRIRVEVVRRGYRVWFRCSDDGRGVDLDAVRRALRERGLAAADIAGYDAGQLLAILLRGGITTSATVTQLAGRGIGLDVVRAAMQGLNGEVSAVSGAGQGLSVEMRVPLSLAALEVLTVEADGQLVALPLDAVKGTLRIAQDEVVRTADGELIAYQGQTIALLPLTLGLRGRAPHRWAAPAMTVVIVEAGGMPMALAVARLHGIATVVLRALPALAPADPLVLGLHLDGEGNPRMVLDPDALSGAMAQQHAVRTGIAAAAKPILIVDDSLTTRMLECSILESAGFEVAMAASAEEGLEMARRGDYALFLVDVEMPGMDGFSFIQCTREDPALREVPCILVTSCDAPEYRRRGAAVGASAYLIKSEFDQVDFLQRVGALVRQ